MWMWVCRCCLCFLGCGRSLSSLLESDLRRLCDRPMEENILSLTRGRQTRWRWHGLGGECHGRGSVSSRYRTRDVIMLSPPTNSEGHLRARKVGLCRHCLWLEHRGRRHCMHKRSSENFPRGGHARLAWHGGCWCRLVHALGHSNVAIRGGGGGALLT